jgi:RNA polymerase sigma-B factor
VIRAVRDYDPARGSGFLAYAVPTILGELRRYLRDHSWSVRAPRRLQELRAEIAQNSAELAQSLGRMPSPDDIAGYIGAGVDEVERAMLTTTGMRPVSLDAPAGADTDQALHELIGRSDPAMDLVDYRLSLGPMIAALPPASQELLRLRFGAELTQSEIAARLGTSQMNISRMLTSILGRFRRALLSSD